MSTSHFWAHDPDAVWLVESGTVMLFLASTDEAASGQPRRFICDAKQGGMVVGVASGLVPGHGLLCTLAPGSSVRKAELSSLDATAGASRARIEDWMKSVLREVDTKGTWTEARALLASLSGHGETAEIMQLHARARDFARALLSYRYERIGEEERREAERLARMKDLDHAHFAAAMGEISKGSLFRDEFGAGGSADHEGDGLLAACRFLERARQVRFVSPGATRGDDNENVEMLAEMSGVRARRILLDGPWWSEEGGPLLARFSDNELKKDHLGGRHWVALLPGPVSGYRLYSAKPAPGLAQGAVVDEALAQRLSPFAYTFYRTFPRQKLGVIDVIKFGFDRKTRDIAILLLASLFAGALGLLMPVISGKLIDVVIPARNELQLWEFVAGLLVAGLTSLLFDALRTVAVLRIEARTGVSVQAAILDRVISLPAGFFRQFSSGDLALRMAAVNSIQHTVTGSTVGTILTSMFLLGNFALLLWYSPRMTIVVLGMMALLFLVSALIGFARLRLARQIEELSGKLHSMVYEYLSGISKIRTSASEQRAFVNWTDRFIHFRRLNLRSEALGNGEALLLNILGPAMLLLVYYLASMETLAGSANAMGTRFSTGDFIAFNAALFSLLGGLYALLTTAMDLVRLMPVWERAKPIVETLPEAGGKRNERHDPLGGIEIVNLGFRYAGGPEVLRNVNFTAAPGSFVAIVGSSGSGKSTLMRLLLGFEQPTAGSICYDGHDLAGLDVRFLRSRIGTVLQGWRLWPGDIFSNIAASSNLPIDDAREAARISGLEADIEAMPMGMYTVIGDGDSTLSGGQRQRVLIARAVVNRPRILLLDEATSALDNVSQAAVQEALANLDCTRLVIAHRLSTIRAADSIIVLDQGRIVENGTFDELAATQGVFADLLRRQVA